MPEIRILRVGTECVFPPSDRYYAEGGEIEEGNVRVLVGKQIKYIQHKEKLRVMKSILKYMAVSMITIFLFAGCAQQPTEEINAAKASVETVMAEGAQKFAAEEAKQLNDVLQSAQDEIKVQDDKIFKNYTKAKELLAKATADAETLKVTVAAKKEEAKNNAAAAQDAAKASIAEAKALLENAPQGKDSQADIAALKADLQGLEDSLVEVQGAVDSEDYNVAIEKSKAITEKSATISDQVKKAMELVAAKKLEKSKKVNKSKKK
ncbi:MAG: hypothetical protein Q7J01_09020 [Syntrophales bacterium]|nr:hypothetical protein [Syntrophales bacterium]